jgi:LuxR family maltose regulon positive regulatory protein
LSGISKGLTREEIALNSSMPVNTVKFAIKTIYCKLGAYNSTDAIRKAANIGLLKNL